MKMKLMSLVLTASVLALTGCKNISPQTQVLIETQAVAAGVEVGLLKAPTARPYLVAVTPIVCAEAQGTNPSPAQIVAAIQAANINTKTPEAVIIINGVIGIYSAVVDQLGTNSATMQLYATGLCHGLEQGLAFSPAPEPAAANRKSVRRVTFPPHVE